MVLGPPTEALIYEYLRQVPLLTFFVWAFIVVTQLYRRRLRTLTEVAFIIGSFSWAGYALADWFVFNTVAREGAFLAARFSLTFVTAAAFFLFFFSKLFLTKAERLDAVLAIPFVLALGLVWSDRMLLGLEEAPWGWAGVFDPALLLLWVAYIVTYASLGVWYLYRTYLVVREDSHYLGRRLFGIFATLLLTLVLGVATNVIYETLRMGFGPSFSSLLVIPGLLTLYVLVPVGKERISSSLRRFKSKQYQVLGVYLIYENGTLIAARSATEDRKVDDDIFGATLDAIQSFMRTSFPLLIGKWLRRIEHGDVKILIERGRHSYIAVVVRGDDPDTLWVKMREAVQRFERSNEVKLADWNGVTDDLQVVEETLEDMFTDRALFA